jgi:pyridinium-3,5-bisthiocarboxylic acid mononucleotide nickel chelatase
MRSLFFDLPSGAAGDMILASLIDCGAPIENLQSELARLGIPGLRIAAVQEVRNGITARRVSIEAAKEQNLRHYQTILEMIERGGYKPAIARKAHDVLMAIARAEAKVHGIPTEKVHFHEIGAVDTIVDILGTLICLDMLGVDRVYFGTLTIGHGSIQAAHGVMPVPAPATAELLAGFAVRTLDIPTEILTPTGCAILTTIGEQRPYAPSGKVEKTGYGCGAKEFDSQPNVLRAMLFASETVESDVEPVCVIESDIDHISGEVMGYAARQCMLGGALDVSWCPIFMKKGRPGYRLTVVAKPDDRQRLTDCIIVQTRTLGVRWDIKSRTVAKRQKRTAVFEGKKIEEKQCAFKGQSYVKPEYESLTKLAEESNIPLIELLSRYERKLEDGGRLDG